MTASGALGWVEISIHAPGKGATGSIWNTPASCGFQSTLPGRERLVGVVWFDNLSVFQSTLPGRERLPVDAVHAANYQFQSTLPGRERPPDPADARYND